MTNFADRILRPETNDYPVRNLTDIDFYKFSMGQFIFQNYKGVRVRFGLINREQKIPLARIVDEAELRAALDHICTLKIRRTDLSTLRGMDVYGQNMFSNDYLAFLADLRLPTYDLKRVGDQYELFFECEWAEVTLWETIAMAAIMELYYRALMRKLPKRELENMYGMAANKLYRKLLRIKQHGGIRLADFGQRRRHSFLWQRYAIDMAKDVLGEQFTGTSNTYMAFGADLNPIGTNAHELPMVVTALKMIEALKGGLSREDIIPLVRGAQYTVLDQWEQMYGSGLRIILPDTYGSKQFFANMSADQARRIAFDWRGIRQDSGDPVAECWMFINWLKSQGVANPKKAGKVCIFSDGLDVKLDGASGEPDIIELYETFKDEINTPFGWGTNFTNDFKGCLSCADDLVPGLEDLGLKWKDVFKGFSLVCKVIAVIYDGIKVGAVKLSNNILKATGAKEDVAEYIPIYGEDGRIEQKVNV
jgi:nicotinate phosphoribosyltransferase